MSDIENKKKPSNLITNSLTQSKVFDSTDIFAGRQQVMIQHGDDMYRLMITKQGKLILTK